MLLGAEFFLSHRVSVACGRNKLYFTYNGGPIFNRGAGSPRRQEARRICRIMRFPLTRVRGCHCGSLKYHLG